MLVISLNTSFMAKSIFIRSEYKKIAGSKSIWSNVCFSIYSKRWSHSKVKVCFKKLFTIIHARITWIKKLINSFWPIAASYSNFVLLMSSVWNKIGKICKELFGSRLDLGELGWEESFHLCYLGLYFSALVFILSLFFSKFNHRIKQAVT